MKANLSQTYFWQRRNWGPGEVEIPEDLAIALGLYPPADSPLEQSHEHQETGAKGAESSGSATPARKARRTGSKGKQA